MIQSVFADSIEEISVVSGVVRIEWSTHQKKGQQEVERQPSIVLAIPIEGFANAVPPLQQLLQKMIKDGVVKARETPKIAGPQGSPNFQ